MPADREPAENRRLPGGSSVREEDWDALRAHFDTLGMESVEKAVAGGVPQDVAGRRVAEFNDMLIEKLKKKMKGNEK